MSSVWVCQRCERGEGCEVVKVCADKAGASSWLAAVAAERAGTWAVDRQWFTSVNRVDSWNIWEYEVTE